MVILNFIKKHKKGVIITTIVLLVFLILAVIFINKFVLYHGSSYGDRLDGIEEVKLNDDKFRSIEEKLKDQEGISSASASLNGKIIHVFVTASITDNEKLKSTAASILEVLSDEEKKFYDIEIYYSSSENADFSLIGYYRKGSEGFTWSSQS